jgi:hypothetical protein
MTQIALFQTEPFRSMRAQIAECPVPDDIPRHRESQYREFHERIIDELALRIENEQAGCTKHRNRAKALEAGIRRIAANADNPEWVRDHCGDLLAGKAAKEDGDDDAR